MVSLPPPTLSKKIPRPEDVVTAPPPNDWARVSCGTSWLPCSILIDEAGESCKSCDGFTLSLASAAHCCSLPQRHRIKMVERIKASIRVNQAPSGTLNSTDDRYTPSREPKTRKKRRTSIKLVRQTTTATRDTIQVVIS